MPRIRTKLLGYAPDERARDNPPELVYETDKPVRASLWQKLCAMPWEKKRMLADFVALLAFYGGLNIWMASTHQFDWRFPVLSLLAVLVILYGAKALPRQSGSLRRRR